MTGSTRRDFLQTAGTFSAGATAMTFGAAVQGASSNDRPVIGFIGCGGRAQGLVKGFTGDSDLAWACDPDEQRAGKFKQSAGAKQSTSDLRRVLDDRSVDAVVIATPDHWHAPAAIMACEAGKHVYVEKPCSHNLRESRLLLDAARRNKVVVQHGTQSRSNPLIAGAMQMLKEGIIGDVLIAKSWNIQRRSNIGHSSPGDPPKSVDYDTWIGPAEFMPFRQNRFHYNWHWWHNFGTGDIGNDGAHEIDIARWGLGVEGLPTTASATGGKYFFDDDQQFPDTATCVFEWPGDGSVGQRKQLIFEMRLWSSNHPHNVDSGIEFYGTQGLMFVSKRGKLQIFGDDKKPIKDASPKNPPRLAKNHQVDFLDAIRNGNRPAADIAIAHDSVAPIHLANISVRSGRGFRIDPATESIVGDEPANRMLSRKYRVGGHWAVPTGV